MKKGVKLLYWRVPPGYPRPLPVGDWFINPPWPYRWRRPGSGREKAPALMETTGDAATPGEAPGGDKAAQKAEPGAVPPSPKEDPAPPARQEPEPAPVPEEEGKKEDAATRGAATGPLKWHFPQ